MRDRALPAVLGLALLGSGLSVPAAFGQEQMEPVYSIWDVTLGEPVTQVPEAAVGVIACGTNGGPAGLALASFADFMSCPLL